MIRSTSKPPDQWLSRFIGALPANKAPGAEMFRE
jgi:hypothetical protein